MTITIGHISIGGGPPQARALIDPRQLSKDQLGVIVGPKMRSVNGTLIAEESSIDPQLLRHAVLFWDQIVWPDNNYTSFRDQDGDPGFLEAEGLLIRPKVQLSGSWDAGEAMAKTYSEVFEALQNRDANRWSVSREQGGASLLSGVGVSNGGLNFELSQAIPIPDREVPLDEVLSFKLRRLPELNALRSSMAELAEEIAADPDPQAAHERAVKRLQAAVAEHLRVSREVKFPLRLTNQKMTIEWKSFVTAAGFFGETARSGFSIMAAAMAGAAGFVVGSVKADVVRNVRVKTSSPYEYVTLFHKEIFSK